MPRIKCPKCEKAESIQKSGIVRNKQRFYCKNCNYHFTNHSESKNQKNKIKTGSAWQTSLIDIAKEVGVSVSTVSRALHNHPDISERTKAAVNKVVQELSYQPNALAQSLVARTTRTLGVIIPNLNTTFFSTMLSGIQHIAYESGYRVVICQSDESYTSEIANIQALMNNMIDGLLLCHSLNTETSDHIKMYLKRGIPIVQFYRVFPDAGTSNVLCEDEKGAFSITDHLIKMGCKRIALLNGPKHVIISQRRMGGYLKALKKAGIRSDPKLIANIDFSATAVEYTIDQWLKLSDKIDAIFSISDKSGVQAIQYLKSKKIKIPKDICVAGFGNEYTGEIIEPQLTTYDIRNSKIGEYACQLLLDSISNNKKNLENIIIEGYIIERGSTKKIEIKNKISSD